MSVRLPSSIALVLGTAALGGVVLFMAQPLAARLALPSFGGTPKIWLTAALTAQALVLVGYAYAALLNRLSRRVVGLMVHGTLWVGALMLLPPGTPGDTFDPLRQPLAAMTWHMLSGPGPIIALAAAGTVLLQSWSPRLSSMDPLRVYAWSNLGGIAGLLLYVTILEPGATLPNLSVFWSALAVVLAVATLGLGVAAFRKTDTLATASAAETESTSLRATPRTMVLWVALAAVPSTMLLAVTDRLTLDTGAFPLLWVLPLVLYLASFALTFGRSLLVDLPNVHAIHVLSLMGGATVLIVGSGAAWTIPLWLLTLAATAVTCHARLRSLRPVHNDLPAFYVAVGLGGLAGGALVSVAAPLLLPVPWELPLTLLAAALLRPPQAGTPSISKQAGRALQITALASLPAVLLIAVGAGPFGGLLLSLLPFLLVVLTWMQRSMPVGHGLMLAVALGLGSLFHFQGNLIARDRSVLGTYDVREIDDVRFLQQGSTLHGAETANRTAPVTPMAYFHPEGPLGQVMDTVPKNGSVAVIGLGIGGAACLAGPDRPLTVFEIDPTVIRLARDSGLFRTWAQCGAGDELVLADGRLGLQHSERTFDLIVLDAFQSGAVPVHLLTREAVTLYLERLKPGGVLALHLSARHLNLVRLSQGLATALDLPAMVQAHHPAAAMETPSFADVIRTGTWVVMAKTEADLGPLWNDLRWDPIPHSNAAPLWTDDHASLLDVLELGITWRPPWSVLSH